MIQLFHYQVTYFSDSTTPCNSRLLLELQALQDELVNCYILVDNDRHKDVKHVLHKTRIISVQMP